jgi:hypothetical protein
VIKSSLHHLEHSLLHDACSVDPTVGLTSHSVVVPFAFTFAHRALAAAEILALAAALILRRFFGAASTFAAFTLAHLAFAAAAIFARTEADMWRFWGASAGAGVGIPPPPLPAIESIWPCSASICSLIERIWWSWLVVKSVRFVMGDW